MPTRPTITRQTATPTTTSTTSTSTTTSTTTTSTTQKPSTTSKAHTTTLRTTTRLPTTFTDADDIAFLMSLVSFYKSSFKAFFYFSLLFQRQYANIINLTTERSAIANRILEMALNRNGKSVSSKANPTNQIEAAKPSIAETTESPAEVVKKISETRDNINMMSGIIKQYQDGGAAKKLSAAEIARTKQMLQKDISQYNNDIQLLSLLVGRPVSNQDISQLASANLGRASVRSIPELTLPPATLPTTIRTTVRVTQPRVTASTSPIPAFKPLSPKETQFLEALEQIQTTKTTTTTTERTKSVSKSQEALIAALLKQQGFGPNNQVPIEVTKHNFHFNHIQILLPLQKILEQLPLNNVNQYRTSTTVRPFSPLPPLRRQPRPILDGNKMFC